MCRQCAATKTERTFALNIIRRLANGRRLERVRSSKRTAIKARKRAKAQRFGVHKVLREAAKLSAQQPRSPRGRHFVLTRPSECNSSNNNWSGIVRVPPPGQTAAVMHFPRLLSTAVVERSSWTSGGDLTGQRRLTRKGGSSNQRAERASRDRAISVPGDICKMEVRRFRTIF